MIQTRADRLNKVYTLYNNRLEQEIQVNKRGAEIIRKIHKGKFVDDPGALEFINQLKELGFIHNERDGIEKSNIYLGRHCSYKYPLTALSIELTNFCNLRCKHCYGEFSKNVSIEYISFEHIQNILEELGGLHTKKIALTGGEATLHPDFINIALLFLEKGFDLTILTNGYNCIAIEDLLKKSKDYHYTIKVSLDGIDDVHDLIRGKKGTFIHVKETIKNILQYQNITLYISTVIMKQNVDFIGEISHYVKREFPSAIHTFDIIFPAGNATDENTFTISEIKQIMETYPNLFSSYLDPNGKKDKFRCTGGITQCTLSYDGSLKICNSACEDIFKFRHNVFYRGLVYSWTHCGTNIKRFRNEKAYATKACKKCNKIGMCTGKDCRVMALAYLGDVHKSSPITCCSTELLLQKGHRKIEHR